jgi:hypothetical protein
LGLPETRYGNLDDQKLTATHKKLKEKIIATGLQIEGEYKTMLQ